MHKPVTSYNFPNRLRASLIDQNYPAYEEARGLYDAMIDKGAVVNFTTRRLIGNSRHS